MSNIYLKVTVEKNCLLKTSVFRLHHQVNFLGAPTHADIIEFENFFLQHKNQRSRSRTVCDFSIILTLNGIIKF